MGEGELPLDWGMAETLAYATLVDQGYGVRLSGQDTGRGTFSHRHAVLHDQNREKWDAGTWMPLQHIKQGQPDFEVIDSVLSEERRAGIRVRLRDLRAQQARDLGGAVRRLRQRRAGRHRPVHCGRRSRNGVASAGSSLLLPHGYEGQGPEHSSARPERYPAAVRGAQHAGVRADDAGADLPPAAPADGAQLPQAADRDEPEEPAAAQGGRVVAGGARRRHIPDRDRRGRQTRSRETCAA